MADAPRERGLDEVEAAIARQRQNTQAALQDFAETLDLAYDELKTKNRNVAEAAVTEMGTFDLAYHKFTMLQPLASWMDPARGIRDYIVEDDVYWQQAIHALGYLISRFAHRHFHGPRPPLDPAVRLDEENPFFNKYLKPVNNWELYMNDPELCPFMVRSFVWRILIDKIFENYRWAGEGKFGLHYIYSHLDSKMVSSHAPEPERVKLHLWNRFTNNLIWRMQVGSPQDTGPLAHQKRQTAELQISYEVDYNEKQITDVLKSFIRNKDADHGLSYALRGIVNHAINLDRRISLQMAKISWNIDYEPRRFKPQLMEAAKPYDKNSKTFVPLSEKTDSGAAAGEGLQFVIRPMLVRYGAIDGTKFTPPVLLVKSEVCTIAAVDTNADVPMHM